jgi:hypothetical protein
MLRGLTYALIYHVICLCRAVFGLKYDKQHDINPTKNVEFDKTEAAKTVEIDKVEPGKSKEPNARHPRPSSHRQDPRPQGSPANPNSCGRAVRLHHFQGPVCQLGDLSGAHSRPHTALLCMSTALVTALLTLLCSSPWEAHIHDIVREVKRATPSPGIGRNGRRTAHSGGRRPHCVDGQCCGCEGRRWFDRRLDWRVLVVGVLAAKGAASTVSDLLVVVLLAALLMGICITVFAENGECWETRRTEWMGYMYVHCLRRSPFEFPATELQCWWSVRMARGT